MNVEQKQEQQQRWQPHEPRICKLLLAYRQNIPVKYIKDIYDHQYNWISVLKSSSRGYLTTYFTFKRKEMLSVN
jgi:hypothetical protein